MGPGQAGSWKVFFDIDLKVSREPLDSCLSTDRAIRCMFHTSPEGEGWGSPLQDPIRSLPRRSRWELVVGRDRKGRLMFGRQNYTENSGFWLSN